MITKFLKYNKNNTEIKKYFITEFLGTYVILENINIFGNKVPKIKIQIKYILSGNGEVIKQDDSEHKPYNKPLKVIEDLVLFTSDDLEQCKEVIFIIEQSNKYNI